MGDQTQDVAGIVVIFDSADGGMLAVTLTIQRQLTRKVTLELGYIGRRITHEYQPINLNAVPTMMTLGGQQFAQAYEAGHA